MPYPFAKRVADKVVAAILLLVFAPLIVVVVVATVAGGLVASADRGSLLYSEPRISRGRAFRLLKFRTLRREALEELRATAKHARLLEADVANLTWAGRRILKPWYLDEIPQLLNVLRGDISLVGPRPWPPEMVERQRAEGLSYRDEIVAGLTGPAQVTKGSDRQYVGLDLEYVERCRALGPLALVAYDARVLAQTIGVLARGQGLGN